MSEHRERQEPGRVGGGAPVRLGERFLAAVAYASEVHREQRRKGTQIPYLSHLLGVAGIALEHGADETQAIAALLHDAVEDGGGHPRLVEIRSKFGEAVARIVEACTDTDPDASGTLSAAEKKQSWRKRKEAYLEHLAEAPSDALLVSASDKLHNARSILADHRLIGDAIFERFNAGKDGTLWYYQSLVEAFAGTACPESLRVELRATVGELVRRASHLSQ